jgi:hypothetical protein
LGVLKFTRSLIVGMLDALRNEHLHNTETMYISRRESRFLLAIHDDDDSSDAAAAEAEAIIKYINLSVCGSVCAEYGRSCCRRRLSLFLWFLIYPLPALLPRPTRVPAIVGHFSYL